MWWLWLIVVVNITPISFNIVTLFLSENGREELVRLPKKLFSPTKIPVLSSQDALNKSPAVSMRTCSSRKGSSNSTFYLDSDLQMIDPSIVGDSLSPPTPLDSSSSGGGRRKSGSGGSGSTPSSSSTTKKSGIFSRKFWSGHQSTSGNGDPAAA